MENIDDNKKNSSSKKIDKKNIDNVMKIFLVLCVLCYRIPQSIILYYLKIDELYYFQIYWIYLLYLLIPISSIVIWKLYSGDIKKYKLNIIFSILTIIYLLSTAVSYFSSESDLDYNVIDEYNDIMKLDLPSNGEITMNEITSPEDDEFNNEKEYIIDYSSQSTVELEKSIMDNNNWILYSELSENLKSIAYYHNRDLYTMIYNKSTNQYNTFPEENGKYEMCVAAYDVDTKSLTILTYDFIYDYEKFFEFRKK